MRHTALLILALLALATTTMPAQDLQNVEVSGMGTIYNDDKAKGRDDAITDALRSAVEQVAGTTLDSKSLSENSAIVSDEIYAHSRGYVKNFAVMSEEVTDNGKTYNVKIRAQVRREALKEDLSEIVGGIGKVMVVMREKNVNAALFAGLDASEVTENAVIGAMTSRGFEFVDQSTVASSIRRDQEIELINGNTKVAALVAQRLQAEVVVAGSVSLEATSPGDPFPPEMKSIQTTLSFKIINADVGSIVASKNVNAKTIHINTVTGATTAIEDAAGQLADYFQNEVVKILTKGSKQVNLSITGAGNYELYQEFLNTLKYEVRGIKKIRDVEVISGTGLAEIETRFSTSQLASELMYKPFDKFKITITARGPSSIKLKITPKR